MNCRFSIAVCAALCLAAIVAAQPPGPGFGPGPGPAFGPGPGGGDRELVEQFDTDDNGWLQTEERAIAREFVKDHPSERGFGFGPPPGFGPPDENRPEDGPQGDGRPGEARPGDRGPEDLRPGFGPPGGFGFGGPGGRGGRGFPPGMGGERPPASEGVEVAKSSVEAQDGDFYEPSILRTVFIDFESADWEKELEDFHGTDVEAPATLTVDGQEYQNCGISFRGMSSYGMVPRGYKRSFNISIDLADHDQRIGGYKTLNLLNGASDDSMMSTVLYSHIARKYIPAPRANFVRVVINGRDWGVYTNVEQFNKDFVKENFGSGKGARWKVAGSPRGGGGLEYRGDDLESYRYLVNVRTIAKESLDWRTIGLFVEQQTQLIDPLMKVDTRKLSTYESFVAATSADVAAATTHVPRRGHQAMNLKAFADGRRAYLLKGTSGR